MSNVVILCLIVAVVALWASTYMDRGKIMRLRNQRNSLYESLYGVEYETRFSEEQTLAECIKVLSAVAKEQPPTMSFLIDEPSDAVELLLDTERAYYGDWIEGEGGDICLYRDRETKKVVGCYLPLYRRELRVTRFKKERRK